MTGKNKKILALVLCAVMALSLGGNAFAGTLSAQDGYSASYDRASACVLGTVSSPLPGYVGGDWAVVGLSRGGSSVPEGYYSGYDTALRSLLRDKNGILSSNKYSEYSRTVIALTAMGCDPTDFEGYDLLLPLGDYEKTVSQGITGAVFALIALDCGDYAVPLNAGAKTQASRQMYVDYILDRQLSDGGFSLSGEGGADPDVTAMALQALSGYVTESVVKTAAERAAACLSSLQNADGGYSSYSVPNSESTAQVVIALTALGISPGDARFVKNGNTLLDALRGYQLPNGGFRHASSGSEADEMATEQCLCALAAAKRYYSGGTKLYDMTDENSSGVKSGLAGKDAEVAAVKVKDPYIDFSDVADSAEHTAILALASRGIINGMGDGTYAPKSTMTRAQFAAITVRALGLGKSETAAFADVSADAWYAGYIGTAYKKGIVNGISDTLFAPEGTITRQEAVTMVARAAKLCGLDTSISDSEISSFLASYTDSGAIVGWAESSAAFCRKYGVTDVSRTTFGPLQNVTRDEIAQMLYDLLTKSELI